MIGTRSPSAAATCVGGSRESDHQEGPHAQARQHGEAGEEGAVKAKNLLKVSKETLKEALQTYFESQFTSRHIVVAVRHADTGYFESGREVDAVVVEVEPVEEASVQ